MKDDQEPQAAGRAIGVARLAGGLGALAPAESRQAKVWPASD